MNLVDTNILLHATNADATQHNAARTWLEGALGGAAGVGFAWMSVTGFLRISTRPGVFVRPLSVDQASSHVESWLGQPSAMLLAPTPRHLHVLTGLLRQVGTAGNLVSDAHLAALAIEHRADIVTFDRDFDRFPGIRRITPA